MAAVKVLCGKKQDWKKGNELGIFIIIQTKDGGSLNQREIESKLFIEDIWFNEWWVVKGKTKKRRFNSSYNLSFWKDGSVIHWDSEHRQEMSVWGEDSKFSLGHACLVWAVSGALNGDVQGS